MDCEADEIDLLIACDANAHNTVWGSSDCNNRDEAHLEFLGTTNKILGNFEFGLQADLQKLSKRGGFRHLAGYNLLHNWGQGSDLGRSRKRSPSPHHL